VIEYRHEGNLDRIRGHSDSREATRFVAVLEALWGYFTLDVLVAGGIKTISTRKLQLKLREAA
jgi:hypothetical protein